MRRSSHNFVSTFDTSFDSAAEEDGSVPGNGRKRPRYSFQRDDWHVVDEPMDSEEDQPIQDWWEDTDQIIAHEPEEFADDKPPEDSSPLDITEVVAQPNGEESSPNESPIFIKPSLDTPRGLFRAQMSSSNTSAASFEDRLRSSINLPTDTPHLKPIPSPGLPIPSPIVSGHGNSQGYFSTNDLPTHPQTLPPATPSADLVESLADPNASVHFTPVFTLGEPSRDSEGIESEKNYNSSHGNTDDPGPHQLSPLAPEKIPYPRIDDFLPVSEDLGLVQNDLAVSTDPKIDAELPHYPSAPTTGAAIQYQAFESPHTMGDLIGIDHGDIMPDELKHSPEASQTTQELTRPGHREQPDVEFADSQFQELQSEQEQEYSDHGDLTRGSPSTEQVDYPELHSSSEEGSEAASEISDQEQDADMDDQSKGSPGFEDDDEQEEETPPESEAESEAAELPRPPPAQAEVIVLDSDSEDELASDNLHTHKDTRINENLEDDMSDDGEGENIDNDDVEKRWSESEQDKQDDSYVGDSESEERNTLDYDERVHESDREDESSVDVLARDHYPEIQHSQGSSVEYESDEQNEESAEDDYSANRRSASASKQESIIVLDSEEEESDDEEDKPLQETTSPPEEKPRIMNALDGTLDDDFVDNDHNYSEHKDEASMLSENMEDVHGLPTRPFEHQFPTPDPTQEKSADPSNDEQKDTSSASPKYTENESQESSPEVNATANATEIAPVGLMAKGVEISLPLESTHDTEAEDNLSNQDDERGELDTAVKQPSETLVDPQKSAEKALVEPPSIVINQLPFPDRNAHGLRSKLSYFAPLATLVDHYNALVDTISVVHYVSPVAQATSGPKEHYVTIQLTDPSMAGTIVQAQIFRAHRSAIPSPGEGDAVLLRNFKVRSYDHCIMLISVETSSWAVFDGSLHEPRIEGPPVEYGNEEQSYAAELRNWYSDTGAAMIADHELQSSIHEDNLDRQPSPGSPGSVVFSESGSIESISRGGHKRSPRGSRRRRSHRRVTIHELRDGRRYTEVGSPSSKESIHELRDGTVYANL